MRRDSEHRDPVRSIWVYCRRRGRTCIHSERQQVTRRIEEYPTGQNVKALRHGHIFRHCSKHWHSPRGGQQICRRATERLVSVRSEHTSWLQRSQHRWNWERQDNIGETDSECVAALLSQNVDLQCAHWIPGHTSLPENIGWCFSIWWWDYAPCLRTQCARYQHLSSIWHIYPAGSHSACRFCIFTFASHSGTGGSLRRNRQRYANGIQRPRHRWNFCIFGCHARHTLCDIPR